MTSTVYLPPQVLPRVFTLAECTEMIEFAETADWSIERDSVDEHPAWELDVLRHPLGKSAAGRLRQRLLEQRPEIQLKNYYIYIRKYGPASRRSLAPHEDRSLVSFTAALNDDYEGGAFVATGDDEEQQCIPLSVGDAVVFGGNVLHAIRPVTTGTRYSIVMHCI
jgi:predicted 2-oxoglutarate/Fe(II)-dependent dioxygenase YbiX